MSLRFQRCLDRVTRFSNRWWYGPFLALLLALDAFVVIIPNEPLIAVGVIAKPRSWVRLGLWMTVGSALGAVALAALVGNYSDWILSHISESTFRSKSWHESVHLINDHGLWGLALISFSPLPQHAAVILVGLTRLPLWRVFLAVLIGRLPKYLPISWLAARSPDVLRRWKILSPNSSHAQPKCTEGVGPSVPVKPLFRSDQSQAAERGLHPDR